MHYDTAHRWIGVEPVSEPVSAVRRAADAHHAALRPFCGPTRPIASTMQQQFVAEAAPMAALPMAGFMLHDNFVLVEALTAEQRLDEPGEVDREIFEALQVRAVSGGTTPELIQAAMADLRGCGGAAG